MIWPRFRGRSDAFAFGVRDGLHEAHLVPNADRTVELYLALLEHLVPATDVHVQDWRSGSAWAGVSLATGDVRDAIARSKQALGTFAGCEVTVSGGGEQVTLTANLEVFVFADTDRWLYLLQGKGLARVANVRRRSWALGPADFRGMNQGNTSAGALIAERLGLVIEPAGGG